MSKSSINNIINFPTTEDTPSNSAIVSELDERIHLLSNDITHPDPSYKIINGTPEHILDIEHLSKTKLMEKYKSTYSSHRNMLQRRHKGIKVHKEFIEFTSFLTHMGPRPSLHYTLDRIDNNRREYGPGLCAWRNKRDQANNRSTTIYLTHKDGTSLPLTTWARILKVKPDTLRARKRSGWTDQEIIQGHRNKKNSDELPYPWYGNRETQIKLEMEYIKRNLDITRADFAFMKIQAKLSYYEEILKELSPPDGYPMSKRVNTSYYKYGKKYNIWVKRHNELLDKLYPKKVNKPKSIYEKAKEYCEKHGPAN